MSSRGLGPEKILEQEFLLCLHALGFWVCVYESKAQWSGAAQRFCRQVLPKGHPDLLAVSAEGYPCAIELKAPGKRSTIRADQYTFLQNLISHNVFAVCCDNVDDFESWFRQWISLEDPSERQAFALELLPRPRKF
jgi:hypothetical protein